MGSIFSKSRRRQNDACTTRLKVASHRTKVDENSHAPDPETIKSVRFFVSGRSFVDRRAELLILSVQNMLARSIKRNAVSNLQ